MKFSMTARFIIAGCHAWFGGGCLLRPDLDLTSRAYAPFGPLTPWGLAMMTIAVVLVLARPGGLLLMLSTLTSSAMFFTVGILLTLGVGILPTGSQVTWLGISSLILFGHAFEAWLQDRPTFHALVEKLKRRWGRREP